MNERNKVNKTWCAPIQSNDAAKEEEILLHLVDWVKNSPFNFLSPFPAISQQENILLSQRGPGNIKVVDFGSSCYEQQRGK